MATATRPTDVHRLVRTLSSEATGEHGVPPAMAANASAATLRKFGSLNGVPSRRVRDYFWGVVRRGALGSSDAPAGLTARYLAAALAEDLLSAGHPSERVREEVARRFGRRLPEGTIDRIDHRLAASVATGTSPI